MPPPTAELGADPRPQLAGRPLRVPDDQDRIDVDSVILAVWISGGALAALGGVLLGLAEQVGFEMGFKQLLLIFAGITLGGLGTAYGALVGGFIIASSMSFAESFHGVGVCASASPRLRAGST